MFCLNGRGASVCWALLWKARALLKCPPALSCGFGEHVNESLQHSSMNERRHGDTFERDVCSCVVFKCQDDVCGSNCALQLLADVQHHQTVLWQVLLLLILQVNHLKKKLTD